MTEIEKLETAVSKKIEQWNVEDLGTISSDEELHHIFIKPDILNECIERSSKNKEVLDLLVPLSIKIIFQNASKDVSDIGNKFLEKKITLEQFHNEIENMLKHSVYERMLVYYLIVVLDSENAQKYETLMREDCLDIKNKILALASNQETIIVIYDVINNLFDLVYPLRTKYYQLTNVDILDEETNQELENVLEMMNTLAEQIGKQLSALTAGENI